MSTGPHDPNPLSPFRHGSGGRPSQDRRAPSAIRVTPSRHRLRSGGRSRIVVPPGKTLSTVPTTDNSVNNGNYFESKFVLRWWRVRRRCNSPCSLSSVEEGLGYGVFVLSQRDGSGPLRSERPDLFPPVPWRTKSLRFWGRLPGGDDEGKVGTDHRVTSVSPDDPCPPYRPSGLVLPTKTVESRLPHTSPSSPFQRRRPCARGRGLYTFLSSSRPSHGSGPLRDETSLSSPPQSRHRGQSPSRYFGV